MPFWTASATRSQQKAKPDTQKEIVVSHQTRNLFGDGDCSNHTEPTEMETRDSKIVWDSHGNVALSDFRGAHAATKIVFKLSKECRMLL